MHYREQRKEVVVDSELNFVNLETLSNGAAVERFNDELSKVLSNIKDPNTTATAARKVVLTVTFKPANEDRDRAFVSIDCSSKIAPPKPVETLIYVAKHEGEVVACENNPKQPRLYSDAELKEGAAH